MPSCRSGLWCPYSGYSSFWFLLEVIAVFLKDYLSSHLKLFYLACPYKGYSIRVTSKLTLQLEQRIKCQENTDGLYFTCMIYFLFLGFFFVSYTVWPFLSTLALTTPINNIWKYMGAETVLTSEYTVHLHIVWRSMFQALVFSTEIPACHDEKKGMLTVFVSDKRILVYTSSTCPSIQ